MPRQNLVSAHGHMVTLHCDEERTLSVSPGNPPCTRSYSHNAEMHLLAMKILPHAWHGGISPHVELRHLDIHVLSQYHALRALHAYTAAPLDCTTLKGFLSAFEVTRGETLSWQGNQIRSYYISSSHTRLIRCLTLRRLRLQAASLRRREARRYDNHVPCSLPCMADPAGAIYMLAVGGWHGAPPRISKVLLM